MAETAPTGIITLMFTDIQDSAALWERMGESFRPVLDRHNQLIRDLIGQWDGYEVKTQGDSFMVAFERASDAMQCAVEIQREMAAQEWPEAIGELLVRVGMHAGEPFLGYEASGRPDYFGPMVNRASRIAAAGHGGQILLSAATLDVAQGTLTGDLQLLDLGRHRLRGLEQSEHLFEVRHPDLPARSFPPLRTLDSLRTNLPTHLTSFVGREKELAHVQRLLARSEPRLLTITGPSGSGKTRLAHEVVAGSAGSFADGVWLVELADVDAPETVAPRIAAAVQLPLLPDRDPPEQLAAFLEERDLLLVLDSFERAIGASLLVRDLLKSAPRLKCLVTSQIALRLQGEQVYTLPPMRTPSEEASSPDAVLGFDSGVLFVERARAVRDDFALTPENAPMVAEICRKLDGIPLAIELAAAQVVEMSVVEVLEGLGSRLDLLWSESPDVPERHRTLRAAIDWSSSLLNPSEQQVLQELSVFAGGFFRDAAQAVCGTEGLAALRTLHRHSLLNTTETVKGRTRYALLEIVRDYARGKLEEQPELGQEVADRHARCYLEFAESRAPLMRTREEPRALEEIGEELGNLRAAMAWAEQSGQRELCARLALRLCEALYRQGFWEEAGQRLQEGRAATEAVEGSALGLQAAISHALASLAHDTGDFDGARRHARESLALRRQAGDAPGTAEALNLLGLIALDAGEMDAAQPYFKEALDLLPEEDHARRGMVLNNLALLATRRGDVEAARQLYRQGLTHQRLAGDLRHEATTLNNLGILALESDRDSTEARRLYRESLALSRALRDRHGIAVMLNNLGEIAELEGDLDTAIPLFVHAERILRDLHSPHADPTVSLQRLAEQLGEKRWTELRAVAEKSSWEEVVEQSSH